MANMKNLTNATIEHTDLAVLQNRGSLPVFESSIKDSLANSSLGINEEVQLLVKLNQAVSAIKDKSGYESWYDATFA